MAAFSAYYIMFLSFKDLLNTTVNSLKWSQQSLDLNPLNLLWNVVEQEMHVIVVQLLKPAAAV